MNTDMFTSNVDAAAAFERHEHFDDEVRIGDSDTDGPCVGKCGCFPSCTDDPDAANDADFDARWGL